MLGLQGSIVALTTADPEHQGAGRVWLGDDGLVDSVTGTSQVPAGFGSAPIVDLGDAWVLPGVIDLHNHIAYDTLPLWADKGQKTPYAHHDIWPKEKSYAPDVSWPASALAACEPDALVAYVEVKALVGGTTAIQGSPGSNRPRDGWLVRNIDDEAFGSTDRNLIYTSTLTEKPARLADRAAALRNGRGFIYHCAEGQTGSLVTREFADANLQGCLQHRFIAIHCTAVADFTAWKPAPGAVVWSPFSNLWLYGQTTNVPAARQAGLSVCLGSDWAPSGTKHVLGELKVADLWNRRQGWGLSRRQLVEMVTANPGDVLGRCWPHPAGRLESGRLGDVTVLSRRTNDPWTDIVSAREADVVLVVVGGVARYGTDTAMTAAATAPVVSMTVDGTSRLVNLTRPDDPTTSWSWSDVQARLNRVRADPGKALRDALHPPVAGAGRAARHQPPRDRTVLVLDMPGGGAPNAGLPKNPNDWDKIVVPPLESLTHTAAWLDTITGRGFHGGVLDELKTYYS